VHSPPGPTSCGGTWTTDAGSSSNAPASVPSYTAMLVANSITKSGNTISGTKPSLVIVHVGAGYQPSTGHAGTGEVVAVLCP